MHLSAANFFAPSFIPAANFLTSGFLRDKFFKAKHDSRKTYFAQILCKTFSHQKTKKTTRFLKKCAYKPVIWHFEKNLNRFRQTKTHKKTPAKKRELSVATARLYRLSIHTCAYLDFIRLFRLVLYILAIYCVAILFLLLSIHCLLRLYSSLESIFHRYIRSQYPNHIFF